VGPLGKTKPGQEGGKWGLLGKKKEDGRKKSSSKKQKEMKDPRVQRESAKQIWEKHPGQRAFGKQNGATFIPHY